MTDEPKTNDGVYMPAIEPVITPLEQLMARAIDVSGNTDAYEDDRFVEWLEREARERQSPAERRTNERAADAFAARMQQQLRAMRVGQALPRHELKARDASVVGDIKHVADAAASSGCAPWLPNLAVAAGVGRELWDEPCDRWIELPKGIARGRYVALSVAGDSMTPYLNDGDTILIDTRTPVTRGAIVVARRPEDGYVVKYVSRLSRSTMELSSFNAEYKPFTIARDQNSVVGVVAARLARDAD
ncbi:MAG: S24 family peptidase [Gemmatimonadaceae bacterium]